MRIYENQWYQNRLGFLDDELFEGYQQHMLITLGTEYFREMWDLRSTLGFFHPEFVSYVESFLEQDLTYTQEEVLVDPR